MLAIDWPNVCDNTCVCTQHVFLQLPGHFAHQSFSDITLNDWFALLSHIRNITSCLAAKFTVWQLTLQLGCPFCDAMGWTWHCAV